MADEPGPSKRVKYDQSKQGLTNEKLLKILEESDIKEEPFANDSDDDPYYYSQSDSYESEEEEKIDLRPHTPTLHRPPSPQSSSQHCPYNPNNAQLSDWNNIEIPPPTFPFTKQVGLLVDINNSTEPIDYFNLLVTDEFVDMLCTRANRHAIDLIALSNGEEARIARWIDVTPAEMRKFLGLLFHMGTIKLNRINDYWKKHYMFNLNCFSSFMSRNRFLIVLRALQFENTDNHEPRTQYGKIMPLVDIFNNKVKEIYYPTRELSIDESMVLWGGRLTFRQYVKGKRHKFGIKLYQVCEPNGTVLKIFIYKGSASSELSGTGHTEKVVLALMMDYLNNGHSLFMDSFYNSVSLTKQLLEKKTYVTGTLRLNRKGNPTEVVKKKLKTKGELIVQYNSEGICVVKWKDRREILAISSQYNAEMQNITTKRGQQKLKPNLINKYNEFIAGVDHCDQMLSYYTCEHKTLIWYKKLAIHIFQIMLLNSYYLYKQGDFKSKRSFYEFRLCVIEKLLGPPPPQPLPKVNISHLPELCPTNKEGSRINRRRCQICWKKENVRKDSIYYCPLCPNQPGLCLTPCFRVYHTKN